MAKKIRFALKMKNGAEVRTLEELRQAFDLEAVLGYWSEGKLEQWLRDRYYEDEAEGVSKLRQDMPEFCESLCNVLQVPYDKEQAVDLEEMELRRERLRRLKEITDDEEILSKVDQVAFNQEELADRLDEGWDTIYLCGKDFHIPEKVRDKTYIPVDTDLKLTEERAEKYRENGIRIAGMTDVEEKIEVEEKSKRKDIREEILDILSEYQDDNYRIAVRLNLSSKVSWTDMICLWQNRCKSKYSAKKAAEGKLEKAYRYAERALRAGNSDSFSKQMTEAFLKKIEPDVIKIQNMIENTDPPFLNRNKLIIEEVKKKIDLNTLRKQVMEAAERELQDSYYQGVLESFSWYGNFINYEEMRSSETGLFKNEYEYMYHGGEAYELIEKHLEMAAETYQKHGTAQIQDEIIKPVIELVKRLE